MSLNQSDASLRPSYRIVLVGAGGVGKSCLVAQFIAHRFIEDYDPTLEDSYRKKALVDGLPCNLDIIDTAGQDDFLSIRESYYREGEGFLCVYDVTSRSSFHEARWCLEDIKRVKGGEHVPFFLAGNKCDVHTAREVTILEGANLAKTFKCKFLETSAKNRTNVDEAFLTLAKDVICWKMFKDSRPLPIPRKKKLALTPRCVLF